MRSPAVSAQQLAHQLRQIKPLTEGEKRALPRIKIPRYVVLGGDAPETHDGCLACAVKPETRAPGHVGAAITDEERKKLSFGRGVPLRVLLMLYRRARPYTTRQANESPDYYLLRAIEKCRIEDLAGDAVPRSNSSATHHRFDGMDSASRVTRNAVKRLEELGLVEVLRQSGRGQANVYIPHRIEPTVHVPMNLWRNGWFPLVAKGPALLLLLVLLARYQTDRDRLRRMNCEHRQISNDVVGWAERGLRFGDMSVIEELPFSGTVRREAFHRLVELGFLAEARTGGKRGCRSSAQFVLLDPDLQSGARPVQ